MWRCSAAWTGIRAPETERKRPSGSRNGWRSWGSLWNGKNIVYRSLPGAAYLRVLEDGTGEAVPLTPYVYSGTAKDLEAELVFDRTSAAGGCSQREQRARMAGFSGKLVPTYENSFSFACEAKRAGALGVLTIWHADLAHHGTLGESGERRSRRIWPGIIQGSRLRRSGKTLGRSCKNGWGPVR